MSAISFSLSSPPSALSGVIGNQNTMSTSTSSNHHLKSMFSYTKLQRIIFKEWLENVMMTSTSNSKIVTTTSTSGGDYDLYNYLKDGVVLVK